MISARNLVLCYERECVFDNVAFQATLSLFFDKRIGEISTQ